MRKFGRRVLTVVLVAVAVLVAEVAVLWTFQRRHIYLPDAEPVRAAAQVMSGAIDVVLPTEDGLELQAWYIPSPADGGCRPTVLFAPGNAGNRADRIDLARALREAGFGVLLLDYRGYGGNPGRPSEDGLVADARSAHAYLTGPAGLAPAELIYFGESLGGAVVTRLAVEQPAAGLLLRSPFTDLADVARRQLPFLPVRLLLWDQFPVAELIGGVDAPVTVVYGTRDSLVPPEMSQLVAQRVAGQSVSVAVEGAGHNDAALTHGPAVIAATVDLAARAGCPVPG